MTRSEKLRRFQHVLKAAATKCGFRMLEDDGMMVFRSRDSDCYYVNFVELDEVQRGSPS